ncbi:MAG: GNAT family N-acetyltransferase [Novosphingobium sp.]
MDEVTITRHDAGNRGEYRAHVKDSRHIGRLTWVLRQGVRVADHTLVPPAIGGRGIAALLVEALVEDAREQGFRIEPPVQLCRGMPSIATPNGPTCVTKRER